MNEIKEKSECANSLTERTFIHGISQRFIYNFLLTDVIKISMKTYCLECRKNTENLDSTNFKTKNDRLIMQSKWQKSF